MMQMMLYTTSLITSIIFDQMNHPLAKVLMLLMPTIQICLLTGLMTKSFWYMILIFFWSCISFIYLCNILASIKMVTL